METLIWLIQEYGYVILFFWTLFEGETIVVLAGYAVYQEYMRLEVVIVLTFIGTLIGDHVYFFLGRYKGKQLLDCFPSLGPRVMSVNADLERHHEWIIFGSRFLYGFRTVLPIAMGISNIPSWRFTLFNALGGIVWMVVFLSLGYIFAGAIETFIGNLKRIEGYAVSAVILAIALLQCYFWWRRKKIDRSITANSREG